MGLSIILPISKTLSDERQEHFNFIKAHYESLSIIKEVLIGIDNSNQEYFCKSRAINNGVRLSKYDHLLIVDIDIYLDILQITKAIEEIDNYGWVLPFDQRVELDKKNTLGLIHNTIYSLTGESHGTHIRAGSVQLIKKEIFNLVKGYDERFIGWGGEDTSFCASIECLYKPGGRIIGNAYHLYHKRQENINAYKTNKTENKALRDKYWRYANAKDTKAMKQLIEMRGSYEKS